MPDGGLSTGAVYAGYDRAPAPHPFSGEAAVHALCAGDYSLLNRLAFNDLTPPAQRLSDAVGKAIDDLYACGARFARMSGSGSCCFGVFDDPAAALSALKPRWPKIFSVETRPRGVEFC